MQSRISWACAQEAGRSTSRAVARFTAASQWLTSPSYAVYGAMLTRVSLYHTDPSPVRPLWFKDKPVDPSAK